jgi:hypothetical protein
MMTVELKIQGKSTEVLAVGVAIFLQDLNFLSE